MIPELAFELTVLIRWWRSEIELYIFLHGTLGILLQTGTFFLAYLKIWELIVKELYLECLFVLCPCWHYIWSVWAYLIFLKPVYTIESTAIEALFFRCSWLVRSFCTLQVAVTPVSLVMHVETDVHTAASEWISSALEVEQWKHEPLFSTVCTS